MGPRTVLYLLFILVIIVNIITLMVRKKKFLKLERSVLDLAASLQRTMTLEEISSDLGVSLYDAKILLRKSVSRGTIKEEIMDGQKVFTVK